MADENDPDWLKRWKLQGTGALPPTQPPPADNKDERGRWLPGSSGNPSGRAPGTKTKATILREQFEASADDVRAVVLAEALKGDMQAAGLVLARVVAPLRHAREKTPFALDTSKPLASQAAQVVQAVADGHIAAADAQIVMACLSTYAAIVQSDEVEARLAALEARASINHARGGVVEMEEPHGPDA